MNGFKIWLLNEFENVLHASPAIQIGQPRPEDHVAEPGYAYRTLSQAELQDAQAKGFFVSRPGRSRGGRSDVKHWDVGGGGRFYRASQLQSTFLIRVRSDKVQVDQPVAYHDTEIADPKDWSFRPLK